MLHYTLIYIFSINDEEGYTFPHKKIVDSRLQGTLILTTFLALWKDHKLITNQIKITYIFKRHKKTFE